MWVACISNTRCATTSIATLTMYWQLGILKVIYITMSPTAYQNKLLSYVDIALNSTIAYCQLDKTTISVLFMCIFSI